MTALKPHAREVVVNGFYYLATPYRAHPEGLNAAFGDALLLTARLIDVGFEIFSPIVHSHILAKFVQAADVTSDFWLARQLPMMRGAHGIIVGKLPGWDRSIGVKFEREHFRSAGKIEYFVDPSAYVMTLTCDP